MCGGDRRCAAQSADVVGVGIGRGSTEFAYGEVSRPRAAAAVLVVQQLDSLFSLIFLSGFAHLSHSLCECALALAGLLNRPLFSA